MILKAKPEDEYWRRAESGATYVDEIQLIKYPDSATCFMDLEVGNIDMCPVENADYSRFLREGSDDYDCVLIPIGSVMNFYFSTQNLPEIWGNKRYREAVAYGVDWVQVSKNAVEDRYIQALGVCPTSSPNFLDTGWDELPYDPDLAKEIMTELGYGPNNMLKLHAVSASTETAKVTMETIQFYLKEMYMDLSLEFLDTSASLEAQNQVGVPGIVDLGVTYTRRGSVASRMRESIKYNSQKTPSLSYINDDRYQELFFDLTYSYDLADRDAAMEEIQRYNREELFIIPMYEVAEGFAYRTDRLRPEHITSYFNSRSMIQLTRLVMLPAWE